MNFLKKVSIIFFILIIIFCNKQKVYSQDVIGDYIIAALNWNEAGVQLKKQGDIQASVESFYKAYNIWDKLEQITQDTLIIKRSKENKQRISNLIEEIKKENPDLKIPEPEAEKELILDDKILLEQAKEALLAAKTIWLELDIPQADKETNISEIEDKFSILEKLKADFKSSPIIDEKEKVNIREEEQLLTSTDDMPLKKIRIVKKVRRPRQRNKIFFTDKGIIHAQLPLASTLTVTGRKFIKFSLSNTKYKNNPSANSSTDVNIDQQLQVKVQGVVGEALTVNIDYNDALPEVERQKIGVNYQPKEYKNTPIGKFKPYAGFGDITLSLPSTKYVVYNKSTFGIKGGFEFDNFYIYDFFKLKNLKFDAIASRTEGRSESKEFTANTQLKVNDNLSDADYERRKYYDLLADYDSQAKTTYLPLQVSSIKLYIDDKNSDNDDGLSLQTFYSIDGADSATGYFDELDEGIDYTVDLEKGILHLNTSVNNNYVVAVKFTTATGIDTQFIIKDENYTSKFDEYELKNRYFLGATNIQRNDPNFVIYIKDENGNIINDSGTPYIEIFGLDLDKDNVVDPDFIDYEFGILEFPDSLPFYSVNSEAYNNERGLAITKYKLQVEYTEKVNQIILNFNVIRNSEKVYLDGVLQQRNSDYFIDYQTGFLSFLDTSKIKKDSKIRIDYEVLPFGGTGEETLLGTRLSTTVTDYFSIGTSYLFNGQRKTDDMPLLSEEAKNNQISDVDFQFKPLVMARNIFKRYNLNAAEKFIDPKNITFSFNYEKANSVQNPNVSGKALIDSFEDVQDRLEAGISENSWFITSVTTDYAIDSRSVSAVEDEDDIGHLTDDDLESGETQKSISFSYDFTGSDSWIAYVYNLSRSGVDISKKNYIELWLKGAENMDFSIDIGIVSEDSDNDGQLDTEDENDDDILNPGEDDGYISGKTTVGADNGILDSEDLNNDGILSTAENYYTYSDLNNNPNADTSTYNGWTFYRINIADSDAFVGSPLLTNVRHIRLRFAKKSAAESGKIYLDQLYLLGSTWEDNDLNDNSFIVSSISTIDSPSFSTSPDARSLVGLEDDAAERSIVLTYNNLTSDGYAILRYATSKKIGFYKELIFFVLGNNQDDTGFIEFGKSDNTYYRYEYSLNFSGWQEKKIDLQEIKQQQIQAISQGISGTIEFDNISIVGEPSLDDIAQIKLGVKGDTSMPSGKVILNNIYLNGIEEEKGNAQNFSTSMNLLSGLLNLSYSQDELHGKFLPVGQINSAELNTYVRKQQKNKSISGSIGTNKFIPQKWNLTVPFSFSYSNNYSFLDPDEIQGAKQSDIGTNNSKSYSINSGFNIGSSWPSLTYSFSKSTNSVDQKNLKKYSTSESRNYSSSYSRTIKKLLYFIPTGKSFSTNISTSIGISKNKSDFTLGGNNTFDRTTNRSLNFNYSHRPTNWLNTGFTFSFSDAYHTTQSDVGMTSRNHNFSYTITPSAFWGFSPNFKISTSTAESVTGSTTLDNKTKNVSVTGTFNFSLGLTPSKWWKGLKFLSANYSYNSNTSGAYDKLSSDASPFKPLADFLNNGKFILGKPNFKIKPNDISFFRNKGNASIAHSLSGGLSLFKPTSISYNIGRNETLSQTQNSVSKTLASSFSLNTRTDMNSVFKRLSNVSQSTFFTLNYSYSKSKQVSSSSTSQTPNMNLSFKWSDRLSTNFNFNTNFSKSVSTTTTTKNRSFSPGFNFKYLFSKPIDVTRFLRFKNRFEINGSLSATFAESKQDDKKTTDNSTIAFSASGNYDISENIRTTFGGNFSITQDKIVATNEKTTFGLNTSVDIRF